MIVKLSLDDTTDRELIQAIAAMPKGERSARIKVLLSLALAGTGGLLVRVDALERQVQALSGGPTPSQPTVCAPDPDRKQSMRDLLAQAGTFDE